MGLEAVLGLMIKISPASTKISAVNTNTHRVSYDKLNLPPVGCSVIRSAERFLDI